jgi:thiamine biosynthesis lipoprotein
MGLPLIQDGAVAASGPAGPMPESVLERSGRDWVLTFRAMATPCEVRVETEDRALALCAGEAAMREAVRIERKFSRYRPDSVVGRINAGAGTPFGVDAETAHLLDFSAHCWRISDGLFDITSGVLRRVWTFDGSDKLPARLEVLAARKLVGWRKLRWQDPVILLRDGMEIDLGGVGKEYAVDRALAAARRQIAAPLLVNFGGDLAVSGPRANAERWRVAIESVDRSGAAEAMLEIGAGALATSGDARRYLLKDGVRYSHILDPRSGWPVKDPPRSVTVAAATCLEAGMMATLAMLQGRGAEDFLAREKVRAWCIR